MSLRRRKSLLYWASLSRSLKVSFRSRYRFLLLGFFSGLFALVIEPGFSRIFFWFACGFGFLFWFFSVVLSRVS